MSFSSLNLVAPLLQTLTQLGYHQPTPIQQQAIPLILQGQDILASAQTGTGKTAAFALPIIQQLLEQPAAKAPRALILVPTRELARQVQDNMEAFTQHTALRSVVVYGGACLATQSRELKTGADILIATPGRLLDYLRQGVVHLRDVRFLVFDEADRMLDMGFRDEIRDVVRQVSTERQTLLFSATLSDDIHRMAGKMLRSPQRIDISNNSTPIERIEQRVYVVDQERKLGLLAHLLQTESWPQVLVFSRTREGCDKVATWLQQQSIAARPMHADLSQAVRDKALADFAAGEVRVLVATDVAARGLDIAQLACVINLELPFSAQDYVHRIGRTGRAGHSGLAISLYNDADQRLLTAIEDLLDTRLPQQWYPGFEPDLTREVAPARRRGSDKQRARQLALGKAGGRKKR
ncbi:MULTISPECIES: DEAD/DEAH box helicase [Plesiomonas]|uniref:DEAD-box ATP-dependent RNA helicase RhpA n=1 Tax=Plesiomonas shigelloides 302-73 TaxID=1315976 RepID=R8ARA1_PLESH|nr:MULTISPECIES: DEAD/DEAH box helicase [Plesiomonas]EON88847.1 DEAD/DEAH box helicase domain-containing protein [Plesiomonas shigelloides 302-73]KAB7685270.1 DEAD/DEAH box helicase [Plesiomonas shigelloides]KAB7692888.1 DEAD/DEAH box helicase [Plesiomonas shigelloides]KAB7693591.1 DEAD/DEAH box helicase [Plesiomonas shigelloides]MCE5165319.1 DEAD/DEAH box helicase [Plesiomonas sp. PI-19]